MALLCLLLCYNRIVTVYEKSVSVTASFLRNRLGPEPEDVVVLANGDVCRSSLRGIDLSGAFFYDPDENRIVAQQQQQEGRLRPPPFIGLQVTIHGTVTDLSDWVGELRCAAMPVPLTALQLVQVRFLSQGLYLPSRGFELYSVDRMGDEARMVL